MPKLSIIIPVYNVEPYLDKCISSIIHQTCVDIEIILVDDGSTDNSLLICKKYAEVDSRITLVHQDNLGVSAARNRGLELATGEWIGFVDSDDYLDTNAYEMLVNQAESNNCDVAIMDFAYVDKDGNLVKKREYPYGDAVVLNREEAIRHQFDIPLSIRLVMWNKIFKREVIKDLKYDESLKASEDTLLLHECLMNSHRAVWIRQPLYYNVQRRGSAMRGGLSTKDYYESLKVHKLILENVKARYPEIYDYALVHYLDTCAWKMRSQLACLSNCEKKDRRINYSYISKMKKCIRKETISTIRCKSLSFKRKLAFILIGIRG